MVYFIKLNPTLFLEGATIMALGDIQWLQWKNKSTRERDEQEYAQWAFPFGDAQKEKIIQILHELVPKEDSSIALVCFLTTKEIISKVHQIYSIAAHRDFALESINKDLKRYKRLFRPKDTNVLYCALALADIDITRELKYPSVEELRTSASELAKSLQALNNK